MLHRSNIQHKRVSSDSLGSDFSIWVFISKIKTAEYNENGNFHSVVNNSLKQIFAGC